MRRCAKSYCAFDLVKRLFLERRLAASAGRPPGGIMPALPRVALAAACTVLAALAPGARADQILHLRPISFVQNLPAPTGVQSVQPATWQRGVLVDGSLLAGTSLDVSIAGAPGALGSPLTGARFMRDIDLATGAVVTADVDLALPARVPWIVGRAYNAAQRTSAGASRDSNKYQGWNWSQLSQPELIADNPGNPTVIYLVHGADRYVEFRFFNATVFRGENGAAGALELTTVSGVAVVKYHDATGRVATFFGLQHATVPGQLWKIEDPAGGVAYVGHATNPATAVSLGFDASKRIILAFDSAGHRFSYTYQTGAGDTVARLASVVAETPNGASWTEAGRVEYEYYVTGTAGTNGNIGDLRLARVKLPQSVSGADDVRRTYYRYYPGPWQNTDGLRGSAHMLRMVLGPEGCRRFDWDQGANIDETLADANAATDSTLKPYADAFYEYISASDRRASLAWYDGQNLGTYQFTYNDNTGLGAPNPTNSTYDIGWKTRTIVHEPFKWCTHYFDEAGQPLSWVYTNTDPATSPTSKWVHSVERNTTAQVSRIGTPASVGTYTYSTGAITLSSSTGLVYELARITTGDFTGFLQTVRHRQGAGPGGTAPHDAWVSYWTGSGGQNVPDQNVGGFHIIRPLVAAVREYPALSDDPNSGYNQTSVAYTLYGPGQPLAANMVTTTLPAVSAAHHGSGLPISTSVWLELSGDVTFARSVTGNITYRSFTPLAGELNDGLLRWRVSDADTPRLILLGITIPDGFTSGSGAFHLRTDLEHDAQGRTTAATIPGGRRLKAVYTRLADRRLVGLYLPKAVEGSQYYGPALCRVYNHDGGVEDAGTVAVPFQGATGPGWTATAPTSWIDTGAASIVAALGSPLTFGTLTSNFYSSSGARLTESRRYFDIYGLTGTHFDSTTLAYDSGQRLTDITDPSCTITHLIYDTLDRVVTVQRGVCGTRQTTFLDIATMQYDGGLSGGNGYLTQRTGNANIPQSTDFLNDYQGRPKVVRSGAPPHLLLDYDNLDHIVAAGLYGGDGSALLPTLSPLTFPDLRQGLTQTSFDERNFPYKQQIWDPAYNPPGGQSITTNLWYSPDGHPLMSQGATIEKYSYDHICQNTAVYHLASTDSTTYSGVMAGVSSGDVVLSETHVAYDPVLLLPRVWAEVDRYPDVCGQPTHMGPLTPPDFMLPVPPSPNINVDQDVLANVNFPDAGMFGKMSLSVAWYDGLLREAYWSEFGDTKFSVFGDFVPGLDYLLQEFHYKPGTDPAHPGFGLPTRDKNGPPVWVQEYNPEGLPFDEISPLGIPKITTFDNYPRPTSISDPGNCAGTCTPPAGLDPDPCAGQRLLELIYGGARVLETIYSFPTDGSSAPQGSDGPQGPGGTDGPMGPSGPGTQRQSTRYYYRDTIPSGTLNSFPASDISDNNLVLAVAFPDSPGNPPDWADTYRYGYNRQGQPSGMRDPGQNLLAIEHDARGRLTRRAFTSIGAGFDQRVWSQEIAYGYLGLPEVFTSKDQAGNIVDQADLQRNSWGNLTRFRMDADSALPRDVGAFQIDSQWTLAHPNGAGGGTQGWQQFERTQETLPGGLNLHPDFGGLCAGSIDIDALVGRVSQLQLGSGFSPLTPAAIYGASPQVIPPFPGTDFRFSDDAGYFGIYTPGRTRLPGPGLVQPTFDQRGIHPSWGPPDIGDGIGWNGLTDVDSWFKYQPVPIGEMPDLAREKPRYDPAYRFVGGDDHVVPGFSSKAGYSCGDDLVYFCQGTVPTAPAGYPPRSGPQNNRTEQWNLADARQSPAPAPVPDRSGNFGRYWFDADGDGAYSGADDLEVQGTFDEANQATSCTTQQGNGTPVSIIPAYDANGNLIDDGENFRYTYDAFARLVQVNRRNPNGSAGLLFAKFTYNALGYRTSAVYDLTPAPPAGQPPWAGGDGEVWDEHLDWYVYDEQWRLVAVYRQGPATSPSNPRPTAQLYERYVHHAAGVGGATDSTGLDKVLLRQRDTAAPYGTLDAADETVYPLQNRRGDVTCVADAAGKPIAYTRYSAYGVPYLIRVSDYNQDLTVNSQDFNDFTNDFMNGAPRADINKDGSVNSTDWFDYLADFNNAPAESGRGLLSTSALDNHLGFAGYFWDPNLRMYHVRNRVFDPYRGKWLQRDPIGYAGGLNVYQYCSGDPIGSIDPLGLRPDDNQPPSTKIDRGYHIFDRRDLRTKDDFARFNHYLRQNKQVIVRLENGDLILRNLRSDGSETVHLIKAGPEQYIQLAEYDLRDAHYEIVTVGSREAAEAARAFYGPQIIVIEAGLGSASVVLKYADEFAEAEAGTVTIALAGASNASTEARAARPTQQGPIEAIPQSREYLTDNPQVGWRVGDPINNRTARGADPTWRTVGERYWKNEAHYHPERYSSADLARMRKGSPPQRLNPITGECESKELHHHPDPQRDGGKYEFSPVWPDEHEAIDPHRHTGH